jgi:hypothetical protein
MSDDLKNPGPEDGRLIALKEPHEVEYWTKKFDVTREELEAAVAEVGHSAKKVASHFGFTMNDDDWQDYAPGDETMQDEGDAC